MIITSIGTAINEGLGNGLSVHDDYRGHAGSTSIKVLKRLDEVGLWPIDVLPASAKACIQLARSAADGEVNPGSPSPVSMCGCAIDRDRYADLACVRDAADEADAHCKGLCLHCTRAGKKITDGSYCRNDDLNGGILREANVRLVKIRSNGRMGLAWEQDTEMSMTELSHHYLRNTHNCRERHARRNCGGGEGAF